MRRGTIIVAAIALSDCLGPTEIEVSITTDVPCASVNTTAIAVGPAGDDTRPFATTTKSCVDGGTIGTVVVTPSGSIDDIVGIRVTLGVGSTPGDQCPSDFANCIVARRALHFVPHTAISLPIAMQQSCVGQSCDPNSTCVSGACIDAGTPCDQTNTCTLPTPDAGTDAGPSCDLPPTLVAKTTAVTPHIARTSTGYAIGYETTASYEVTFASISGSASLPIKVTTQTKISPVGAIGTDGVNILATYPTAGNLVAFDVFAPNGSVVTQAGVGAAQSQAPLSGVVYDGKNFTTFIVSAGSPTFVTWDLASNMKLAAAGGTGFSDPAFALFNGTAYGSAHDTTSCWLFRGAYNASVGIVPGPVNTWSPCTTIRIAENAPGVQLLANDNTGQLNLQTATLGPSAIIGAVDPQAIVLLPVSGTQFHVVFGHQGSVSRANIDVTNLGIGTVTPITTASGFTGVGIGFDAVADPSAPSYAVAYWSNTPTPGIYLTRFCN